MERVYNFNAGPSAMPLNVLEEVQHEFLNFNGTGMSIVEISHRSDAYQRMQDETVSLLRKLLAVPDDYVAAFMQGGGSLQFLMHGANFLRRRGGYINTGVWSEKAKEAASFFGEVYDVASSEKDGFTYIPGAADFTVLPDTDYVYITSNNTIHGTQWQDYPTVGVPLFCDASSDFLARPVDVSKFAFIYAGIQKNVGPAGAVIGIMKKELLRTAKKDLPLMLKYGTFFDHDSTYNTPPVFCIYFVNKVLHWLESLGGLAAMEARNRRKAAVIYEAVDESDGFYKGHAAKNSRSIMNITFNLPSAELEKKFVHEAAERNLTGLKGHRSLGGCRASVYNAVTLEACEVLADFMRIFRKNHA